MSFALNPTSPASLTNSICDVEPCYSGLNRPLEGIEAKRWRFFLNQIGQIISFNRETPDVIRTPDGLQRRALTVLNYTYAKVSFPNQLQNRGQTVRITYTGEGDEIESESSWEYLIIVNIDHITPRAYLPSVFIHLFVIKFNHALIKHFILPSIQQRYESVECAPFPAQSPPIACLCQSNYDTYLNSSRVDVQGPAIFIDANLSDLTIPERTALFPRFAQHFYAHSRIILYSFDGGKNFFVCYVVGKETDSEGNHIYTLRHMKFRAAKQSMDYGNAPPSIPYDLFKLVYTSHKVELVFHGVVLLDFERVNPEHWLQKIYSGGESQLHYDLDKIYPNGRRIMYGFAPFLVEIPKILTIHIANKILNEFYTRVQKILSVVIVSESPVNIIAAYAERPLWITPRDEEVFDEMIETQQRASSGGLFPEPM